MLSFGLGICDGKIHCHAVIGWHFFILLQALVYKLKQYHYVVVPLLRRFKQEGPLFRLQHVKSRMSCQKGPIHYHQAEMVLLKWQHVKIYMLKYHNSEALFYGHRGQIVSTKLNYTTLVQLYDYCTTVRKLNTYDMFIPHGAPSLKLT